MRSETISSRPRTWVPSVQSSKLHGRHMPTNKPIAGVERYPSLQVRDVDRLFGPFHVDPLSTILRSAKPPDRELHGNTKLGRFGGRTVERKCLFEVGPHANDLQFCLSYSSLQESESEPIVSVEKLAPIRVGRTCRPPLKACAFVYESKPLASPRFHSGHS